MTAAGCIEAHILLLDGTPATGYRSFLNFLSNFSPDDLATVDTTLALAAARRSTQNARTACAAVRTEPAPLLVVLHHPLSVSQYPRGTVSTVDERAEVRGETITRLHELLATHGASLVVSGHLHDAFGPRVHGFHYLTNVPTTSRGVQRLLEAETADWKLRRRFRILSMAGESVAITDARFVVSRDDSVTASNDPAGVPSGEWRVQPEDSSAVADPYLVHVVEPADARYFPSRAVSSTWELTRVYAVLIWAHDLRSGGSAVDAAAAQATPRAEAAVSCARPGGAQVWRRIFSLPPVLTESGDSERRCSTEGPTHVVADVPADVLRLARACEASGLELHLQVLALAEGAGLSSSEKRPIRTEVHLDTPPRPMGTTAVEHFTVTTVWPRVGYILYFGMLSCTLALVIISWLLRGPLLRCLATVSGALLFCIFQWVCLHPNKTPETCASEF